MSVYLKNGKLIWDFTPRGCKRQTGDAMLPDGVTPCTTKAEARAAEKRAKAAFKQNPPPAAIQRPAAADYALATAFDELTPKFDKMADATARRRAVKELVTYFDSKGFTRIADIGELEIEEYAEWAMEQPLRFWKGGPKRDSKDPMNAGFWITDPDRTRSPAYQNQFMNVLALAFARARKLKADGVPVFKALPRVAFLKFSARQATPVPDDVLEEIFSLVPVHVREAITLTLMFGFRCSECFSLKRTQVDFHLGGVRMRAVEVKENRNSFLHGGPAAMDFLRLLYDQAKARGVDTLISWQRSPKGPWESIKSASETWSRAMDKIEADRGERWRWHDLRANFITDVALNDGPLEAQRRARHRHLSTTQGYIDIADKILRASAARSASRPAVEAGLRALRHVHDMPKRIVALPARGEQKPHRKAPPDHLNASKKAHN